jgi:flagellar basal-body rod modification protein FlgD
VTINQTSAASGTSAPAPVSSSIDENGLGRSAFLNLLVTQLQHQDPTQPQADGEFLAQLAQFSQLEQLQQLNDKIDALTELLGAAATATTVP